MAHLSSIDSLIIWLYNNHSYFFKTESGKEVMTGLTTAFIKRGNDRAHHRRFGFKTTVPKSSWNLFWYIIRKAWDKPYVLGRHVSSNMILDEQEAIRQFDARTAYPVALTWLGHSAFVITARNTHGDPIYYYLDPFFSGVAGPSWLSVFRRLPTGLPVSVLPCPEVIMISHSHRDHFHPPTLMGLSRDTLVITPLKMHRRFFRKNGFTQHIEMDWFDELRIESHQANIICVPARHYSDAFLRRSLWAGYVIEFRRAEKSVKIFFAGDTGYDTGVIEQVRKYGPFDLAIVGIGSFQVNSARSCARGAHMSPEEAAQFVFDIGAKTAHPMHFGTVNLSDESQLDLPQRFQVALRKRGFVGTIVLPRIGQTISLNT